MTLQYPNLPQKVSWLSFMQTHQPDNSKWGEKKSEIKETLCTQYKIQY